MTLDLQAALDIVQTIFAGQRRLIRWFGLYLRPIVLAKSGPRSFRASEQRGHAIGPLWELHRPLQLLLLVMVLLQGPEVDCLQGTWARV